MKHNIRLLLVLWGGLLVFGMATGCTSKGPTRLCDGFQSYETTQHVRDTLKSTGLGAGWKEDTRKTGQSDRRPAYEFVTMKGPFTLAGIDGYLTLTLYNDRLVSTEFSTKYGREFLAKMVEEHNKVPASATQEVTVDRRTKFRYDVDSDGTFRFSWVDPQLEAQWMKWVQDNA